MNPKEVATALFEWVKANCSQEPTDVTNLRLGFCLSLSAIHATLLFSAKGDDRRMEAVKACFDSVDRLLDNLRRDIERAGIKGVEIVNGYAMDESDMPKPPSGGVSH